MVGCYYLISVAQRLSMCIGHPTYAVPKQFVLCKACHTGALLCCIPGLNASTVCDRLVRLAGVAISSRRLCGSALADLAPFRQSAGHEVLYASCLEPVHACACKMLQLIPTGPCKTVFVSVSSGIMTSGSPLDPVTCCLMLVAGRPTSQQHSAFSSAQTAISCCYRF